MTEYVLTPGRDVFTGTPESDTVHARAGADLIFGNDGDDRLFGQFGDDQIDGGRGDNLLDGGRGNDTLNADAPNSHDTVFGRDGNDTINSDDLAHDTVWGGSGRDNLFVNNDFANGGSGNDYLRVGTLNADVVDGVGAINEVKGGAGADRFLVVATLNGASDTVVVDDFSHGDKSFRLLADDDGPGGHDFRGVFINGSSGQIFAAPEANVDIAHVNHDLVLTFNASDHDQIVIHNGDWLHV